jgi:endonuclease/exonuclease/phosphatase (EEP) superfamily protein YafD
VPDDVVVVSLNTRGVAPPGSRLAARYAAIRMALDAGDAEVACLQEVVTWWHLRLVAPRSFRHVSFRRGPIGPAGGLVTFARRPVSGAAYRGFGVPPGVPGLSPAGRLAAGRKGALVTELAGWCVINTHLAPNRDGDWSPAGRFHAQHRAQLAALARIVRRAPAPAVVCGDFNIDRDSALLAGFLAEARLADAFDGTGPATFRAEFLPPGATPRCIDFMLTAAGVGVEAASVAFADPAPLPGGPGYVSDHLGLRASLTLPAAGGPVSRR